MSELFRKIQEATQDVSDRVQEALGVGTADAAPEPKKRRGRPKKTS